MNKNIEFNIELIIEEYSNYIFKVVDNIIGTSLSYEDKEEVVSDAFYLLWKNQNRINSNLKSYLGSIARNCSYDKLRKSKECLEYDENINNSYSSDFDSLLIIKERLKKLSFEEKNIFNMYYVDGLKIKEIASSINKKESSIKVKLFRIRKKLKEGK